MAFLWYLVDQCNSYVPFTIVLFLNKSSNYYIIMHILVNLSILITNTTWINKSKVTDTTELLRLKLREVNK